MLVPGKRQELMTMMMMMMIIERNVPLSTITLLFIWNYFNQSLGGLWYYTLHNISDAKSIVNLLYVLLCLDRPRNKQRYQFYQYPLDCHPPSFVQLPWQTWKLNNNNKKLTSNLQMSKTTEDIQMHCILTY